MSTVERMFSEIEDESVRELQKKEDALRKLEGELKAKLTHVVQELAFAAGSKSGVRDFAIQNALQTGPAGAVFAKMIERDGKLGIQVEVPKKKK